MYSVYLCGQMYQATFDFAENINKNLYSGSD